MPEVYLEELSGLANEIEAQIPQCAEQAPPPDEDADEDGGDDDDNDRGKGNKKDKGDFEEDD
ncbi:MAG TPA: hypothetical protein VF236_10260 [Gaiellaceae bacterium]